VIKCRLCGLSYNLLTESHMKSQHGISLLDYEIDYPEAPLSSESYRQNLRERPRQDHGGFYSEERCEALKRGIREANPEGRKLSPEHLAALRQGHRDYYANPEKWEEFSEQMRILNSGPRLNWTEEQSQERSRITKVVFEDPEIRRRHSRAISLALRGKPFTGDHKKALSEARVEFLKEKGPGISKPTDPEIWLNIYLQRHFPGEWKYVGDYEVWIGRRNPDFLNVNGKKLVIEVFGSFYHNPEYFPNRPTEEELIAHYKKYGFGCLVLWDDEVREDLVIEKVRGFITR